MWHSIVGKSFSLAAFANYVEQTVFSAWKPRFVVLHNTSAPTLQQYLNYAKHGISDEQWLKNLEGYYRDQQHWSAGPHLFIAPSKVLAFTPLNMPGVHSPSWNGVSWGVETVGEYETEPFTPEMRETVITALAILHAKRGLSPDTLHFHKEDPKTTHKSCPGKHMIKADIIAGIHEKLATIPGEHLPDRPTGHA